MITYDNKQEIYYSTKINDGYFFSGFGTKKTDVKKIFSDDYQLFQPTQTHSDIIIRLNYLNNQVSGDGVFTTLPNQVLTIQTADCVPIIFVDRMKNIIGISHQGWKGTLKRLPQKMIKQFIKAGSKKADIIVVIGPAIGACCYDIDSKRRGMFEKEFSAHSQSVFETRDGKIFLNLAYFNYLQLKEIGLTKNQIDFSPFCTKCNDKHFYSYRRDDSQGEMTNFIFQNPEV